MTAASVARAHFGVAGAGGVSGGVVVGGVVVDGGVVVSGDVGDVAFGLVDGLVDGLVAGADRGPALRRRVVLRGSPVELAATGVFRIVGFVRTHASLQLARAVSSPEHVD
jgi:hypothetical protein